MRVAAEGAVVGVNGVTRAAERRLFPGHGGSTLTLALNLPSEI